MSSKREFPPTFRQFVAEYDMDDLRTIREHGCSGGIGGLIYYTETREVFDRYEAEIETILDDIGYIDSNEPQSISLIINARVWCAVEIVADEILDYNER